MSRTKHHGQDNHVGHDYGGRYKCNKSYGNAYGTEGRNKADKERREESKRAVEQGIQDTLNTMDATKKRG